MPPHRVPAYVIAPLARLSSPSAVGTTIWVPGNPTSAEPKRRAYGRMVGPRLPQLPELPHRNLLPLRQPVPVAPLPTK